jgi:beta-lactam-binding protein with PASTA domain
MPVANNFGPTALPPIDPKYARGSQNGQVPEVVGLSQSAATSRLQESGFTVNAVTSASGARAGTVTGASPSGSAIPGSTITIYISDGSVRAPVAPASPDGSPDPASPASPAPDSPAPR